MMKTKFINNILITGTYNGEEVIGRTCFLNNKESVVVIDESARTLIINYHDLKDICKINFVDKTKKQTTKLPQKSAMQSIKIALLKPEILN